MSSLSLQPSLLTVSPWQVAPGTAQSSPAEGATSHRCVGRSILGPNTKLKGREEQEKKREEAAGFGPSPCWGDGSSDCGVRALGLPILILYIESRVGQTPVESWGWDMGEAEQQATPSTRADGVISQPTPCLPISGWNWWRETESRWDHPKKIKLKF